jgi:predicted lipase
VIVFNDGSVQGYQEFLPDGRNHIHFFGTNQVEDVITDLLAFKWFWKGFFVHRGFADYSSRFLKIAESQGLMPEIPTIFTGHSLGGAVAILVAAYYHKKGCTVSVETCGAPKVGGMIFHWQAKGLVVNRYEMDGDMIPAMPPFFYRPVGTKIPIKWEGAQDIESFYWRHQPVSYQPHFPWDLFKGDAS